MENKEFIFLSTFYEKELLRKAVHVLEKEHIDFKMINKTTHASARAPLSVYIEADILVLKSEFEKATNLLEGLVV